MLKYFYSKQARKPSGLFGRFVSRLIFDKGNAVVNELMDEVVDAQKGQTILEIGFGTGTVIKSMADKIGNGVIHGIDFSDAMLDVAQKRNKRHIKSGCVRLTHGNFENMNSSAESYDTICSANTIYFWKDQAATSLQIHSLLKPGGKVVLAFMDKTRMDTLPLDMQIFDTVSPARVEQMLLQAGFVSTTTHQSTKDPSQYCVVGVK
ncbi:class I SAM-dependent methyltransferase [Pseudodesulfovibrio sp. zrk46]|uniref:class I SAM-dependent methyltransferase n=1 Tax=Pseudodesulfovibrio sp. zrk46 TaxID=2725288 RepID=UPI00144A1A0B|nr:class I SAM-dependent methyltransferase [Pseudodesulfovibrio sp. zrk46]QJB56835.1 class I SAM-dependent methyltransferase [Pseudodesulfovibrio sp. zrk46]